MGLDIKKLDMRKLARDKGLMDEVTRRILDDPQAMDDLAREVADKFAEILEKEKNYGLES